MEHAGEEIANQFHFFYPIQVVAKFIPIVAVADEEVFALAKSLNHIVARKDGGPLLVYPRLLLKQYLQTNVVEPDIEIIFNSDIKWDYDQEDFTPRGRYNFHGIFALNNSNGITKTIGRPWVSKLID